MPTRPPFRTPDAEASHDIADATRNERQKTMLLNEAGRLQREHVQALLDESKSVVDRSKKLCRQSQDLLRDGKPDHQNSAIRRFA